MNKLFNILFIIFASIGIVNAADIGNGWDPVSGSKSKIDQILPEDIIKSLPNGEIRAIEDIFSLSVDLAEGYFAKVASVDLRGEKIRFYIYDENGKFVKDAVVHLENILSQVVKPNTAQEQEMARIIRSIYPAALDKDGKVILSARGELSQSKEFFMKHDGTLEKFNPNDPNQASKYRNDDLRNTMVDAKGHLERATNQRDDGKKTLTTASYIVAVLTMDNSVIDIEASLNYRTIVLRSDYEFLDKDNNFKAFFDEAFLYMAFNFQVGLNDISAEVKLFLAGTFFLLSTLYLAITKGTEALQEIRNQDDLIEKGTMAVVLLVFFYISTEYKSIDGVERYNQTTFQSTFAEILKKGTGYGDRASQALTFTYIDNHRKDIRLASASELYTLTFRHKQNQNAIEALKKIQDKCVSEYDKEKLSIWASKIAKGSRYPHSEDLWKNKDLHINGTENWYLKDGITDTNLTLSLCRTTDDNIKYLQYDQLAIQKALGLIDDAQNSASSVKEAVSEGAYIDAIKRTWGYNEARDKESRILKGLTNNALESSYQHGFIVAPFVSLFDAAIRNIHNDGFFEKYKKQALTNIQTNGNVSGTRQGYVQIVNDENATWQDALKFYLLHPITSTLDSLTFAVTGEISNPHENIEAILGYVPYMMVPGFQTIYELSDSVLPSSVVDTLSSGNPIAAAFAAGGDKSSKNNSCICHSCYHG